MTRIQHAHVSSKTGALFVTIQHLWDYSENIPYLPLDHVGYWGKDSCSFPPDDGGVILRDNGLDVIGQYKGAAANVHIYDLDEYHSRHRSLVISQHTKGKRVAIVGAGSIGQKMAKELAKIGADVSLFDNDTIEVQNPYRLNLGLPVELLVGIRKTSVMVEDIRMSIPGATVEGYCIDVAADSKKFDRVIEAIHPDVMIVSVDTRDGTRQANATARHFKIPLFHVVLSDGAETGQIRYVSPDPDAACLLCMNAWDHSSEVVDSRRQYAEDQSPAQKAVPALSIDTAIIAYVACKIVTAHLAGEDVRRYFSVTGAEGKCEGDLMWVSTTPETWITDDFLQKVVAKVEKSPKCPGCWTPDLEAICKKKKEREERK